MPLLSCSEIFARNLINYTIFFRDTNGIRTHKHLVCERTLNHLAKLVKWSCCVMSTYLYGAFDRMLLSCHVRVSE